MSPKQRTEDLILDLAASPVPQVIPAGATVTGLLAFLGLVIGVFLWVFDLRPDLFTALATLPVLAKSLLPLALFVMAFRLALVSLRPGASFAIWPLALPFAAGLVLVGQRVSDGGTLLTEMMGQTAIACVSAISLLSVVPLLAGLILMRQGAPTRPILTGSLTGLAIGAATASGYALHCSEDSPLFFMVWYSLGIVVAASCGAAIGYRLLRW
jgi:hypothetical protein